MCMCMIVGCSHHVIYIHRQTSNEETSIVYGERKRILEFNRQKNEGQHSYQTTTKYQSCEERTRTEGNPSPRKSINTDLLRISSYINSKSIAVFWRLEIFGFILVYN